MEERLRKFAHLVDAGSFTKASAELHVSQPALSTAIGKLERELHTPLLVRGSRSFQLTEAGKLAYNTAKELAVSTSNLATKLHSLAHQQPTVSIGMIDSVANALFAVRAHVEALERQAKVSIVVNNSRYLLQAVERDELDIAFITERPGRTPSLTQLTHIGTEPLVMVCHAAHASAVNEAITRGNLPHFISYDQPSTSHQLIRSALLRRGIEPATTFYSTSPEVMLRLVLLQKGAAVLPYPLVGDLLKRGKLTWIGGDQPLIIERNIATVIRREKEIALPLTNVTKQIQRLLNQHQQAVAKLTTTDISISTPDNDLIL